MNAVPIVLGCVLLAGGLPMKIASEGAGDRTPSSKVATETPDGTHGPSGVIVLRNLSLHYGPVSFDHGLHVRMSNFRDGCAACHHDIAEANSNGETVQACRSCHAPTPGASSASMPGLKGAYHRQCLSCHRDWSHENACSFCHLPAESFGDAVRMPMGYHGTAERREAQQTYVYVTRHEPMPIATFHHADHADRFGLSCVDCHHGASCTDCHGSRSVNYTMDHRMGTCFECHQWSSCTTCHDLGAKPRFDHAYTAGWPLEPSHDGIGCTGCHSPEDRFNAPTSDRCKACHRVGADGRFDHAEMGVPLLGDHASIDCVMCHRGRLHIGATADCTACHADKRFPEDLPGRGR